MKTKTILTIATLMCSLGFFIHTLDSAYALNPVGISTGSNPVFSRAGSVGNNSTNVTISHQTGQELMISDIFMHANSGWNLELTFSTSSGTVLGIYRTYGIDNMLPIQLKSPLRVPEGEDLILGISGSGVYTVSGYRVQP